MLFLLVKNGECDVPEVAAFAHGVRRDVAAVKAAFHIPSSDGPIEGLVHRLNFLKRQRYGRGSISPMVPSFLPS